MTLVMKQQKNINQDGKLAKKIHKPINWQQKMDGLTIILGLNQRRNRVGIGIEKLVMKKQRNITQKWSLRKGILQRIFLQIKTNGLTITLGSKDQNIGERKMNKCQIKLPWDDSMTYALQPTSPRQQALTDARHPCTQTT